MAAFAADPSAGVVGIGGVMYDRPHLTRAQRLLARVKPAIGFESPGLRSPSAQTPAGQQNGRAEARPLVRIKGKLGYQPQLLQRGRTGTTTVRAGATISVRCTVVYCGGISSYATPSGSTITVFGTITVS